MTEDNTEADHLVPGERCPMSGRVISWDAEAWIAEFGRCWKCGGMTRIKVRSTDVSPWAKALTHKVPPATEKADA